MFQKSQKHCKILLYVNYSQAVHESARLQAVFAARVQRSCTLFCARLI